MKLRAAGQAFSFRTHGSRGQLSLGELSWVQRGSQNWQATLKNSDLRGVAYYSGAGLFMNYSLRSKMREGTLREAAEGLTFDSKRGLGLRFSGNVKKRLFSQQGYAKLKVRRSRIDMFSFHIHPQFIESILSANIHALGPPNHFVGPDNAVLLLDAEGRDRNFEFKARKRRGPIRLDDKAFLGQFEIKMEGK